MTELDPGRSVWTELRRVVPPVYVPIGLATLSVSIVLPVLPLYLEDRGVGLSVVGAVMAATGVGAALAGLPASAFGERFGNDQMMLVGVALLALGTAFLGFTEVAVLLVAMRVLAGLGLGATGQSRQLFIARGVPVHFRGRVGSMMGGTHRLALVAGPLLGGWVGQTAGFRAAFLLAGAVAAAAAVWWVLPGGREVLPPVAAPPARLWPTLRRHRGLLARSGIGPMLIMGGREGRYVLIPLIAVRLDLTAAEIGSLVALGTAVDFVLFPLSGWVMDRFGRLHAIVPAFTLMAVGLVMLGRAGTVTEVAVASVLIGMGNGLTSGSVLTIGSDLAPAGEQGPFLAGYNLLANAGLFVGPFLVGWVGDVAGLDVSAYVMAALLMAGVVWIAVMVGETRGEEGQLTTSP